MRTKLFILFAAVAFTFGAANVFAEGTPANEGKVNLSIEIHPIQTLIIKNSPNVALEYKTKENYDQGVSKKIDDHIQIYSTSGFEVKAKTNNPNLVGTGTNTNKTIATTDISLTPENGSSSLQVGGLTTANLSGTSEVLVITSQTGGVDKTFDITYAAKGNNEYINHFVKGENPTIYNTEVTYTIVAK